MKTHAELSALAPRRCTAQDMTFNGRCLNCGFSDPTCGPRLHPHPSRVTVTTQFHVTGLQPECSICRRRHGNEIKHECE